MPAEVVAPFIIGADNFKDQPQRLLIFFLVCLFLGMAVRAQASRPKESALPIRRQIRWSVVGVSGFAFVIWAHAVTNHPPLFSWLDQSTAGLGALLFGAVAPRLVPAAAQEPAAAEE